MNDALTNIKNKANAFWEGKNKKQKFWFLGISLILILGIIVAFTLSNRTNLVPLYSDLTPSETGGIKENLDGRGIESEVADNGTTIMVPEESVDTLKVELAAEGIPDSGNIDYSFFGQNAGLGMTENEFNVLKLDATQTELANLIKKIDGVQDASVMITIPDDGVFVNESTEKASASIVLKTKSGYQFEEAQVKSLYHLVSKSVPNLPTDNIVIMNQNFEYFDLKNDENLQAGTNFTTQHEIKKEIERDIQRQVQSMLGTIMGRDKVVVSVTADVDFTQENREENLVSPVDEENMEGLTISAQRLTETYTGEGASAQGGVPQSEDSSDSLGTSYVAGSDGNGDYEKVEETINSEVNRIKKEIIESPYKVKDLGIQVMVEPPNVDDINSLSQQSKDDIVKVLGTIIRTTIDKDSAEETLNDEDINNKIALSVQPFNGKVEFKNEVKNTVPVWIYIVGGILLLVIIILLILFLRSRRTEDFEEEEEMIDVSAEVPNLNNETETEATLKRKQLEKLAKEKPDEFAKLLRSWIAED
ncbi:flagellar M-ring protein FliF [Peribacillus psychrosaccharolyticus]|uniref:Flagellar M-ring protein n=1 Tax=Peribacillus psychrosaccharolyticus TaxID=1407 RepID=A0A974NPD3_PERPY|nr:flagellar basal-body MS-ring/collar protein FliF [Peribacillus psychrosaccharolyticus]MEC2053801.1 flagellar basal-body MS-ring/collar protein FliF [Peribacillus psychrosaccharolyticus]MED3742585.1 flagellar basal-body MS-ring/collar protein FliF [Peribacillus psychrosaccharolyticus]QQT01532.1 flagellar M-ring protein FliF [Peribacillus psychrosaccharolyticus]